MASPVVLAVRHPVLYIYHLYILCGFPCGLRIPCWSVDGAWDVRRVWRELIGLRVHRQRETNSNGRGTVTSGPIRAGNICCWKDSDMIVDRIMYGVWISRGLFDLLLYASSLVAAFLWGGGDFFVQP